MFVNAFHGIPLSAIKKPLHSIVYLNLISYSQAKSSHFSFVCAHFIFSFYSQSGSKMQFVHIFEHFSSTPLGSLIKMHFEMC